MRADAFDRFVDAAMEDWGGPVAMQMWAPGIAEDEQARRWWAKLLRSGSSPAGAAALLGLYTKNETNIRPSALRDHGADAG